MDPQVIMNAKHFNLLLVTDGVYAAIANEGTGSLSNSGFVDLGHSVLVFDSFNTQQAAEELRKAIHEVVEKPVSYVINSHWHGDHIRGNQVFRDVSIVATEHTKTIMQERHPARIAAHKAGLEELREYIKRLEEQMSSVIDATEQRKLGHQISFLREIETSLPTLELVLPNVTFESEWYPDGASRTMEIISLGGGHTASDAILYVPDAKVCFVGDLVAVGNHMLIVDGNVGDWITILDRLNHWDIDYIIPGHGSVGGKEWITKARHYLIDLLDMADSLAASDISIDELDKIELAAEHRNWAHGEIYIKNLKHLLSLPS